MKAITVLRENFGLAKQDYYYYYYYKPADYITKYKTTEWLFVRARTDRILAIRTAYNHVTIQVASRDKLR